MDDRNLFTVDKEAVPEREVYLSLLAKEIHGYSRVHKQSEHLSYPPKICMQYLKYKDEYLKRFQTCLKRYKGMTIDDFSGPKREIIEELINDDIQNSIDEAVELISGDFEDFNYKSPKKKQLKINLYSDNNTHANSYVRGLHSNIVTSSIDLSEVIITPKLKKTRIDKFEDKVKAIGKSGLKRVALKFAEKRALMDGEKYKFKKLVSEISEACEDYFLNSKTGKPESNLSSTKNADLAKKIINNYEILENNNYLIDVSGYKKAVEMHITQNFEKYSISNSK